MKKLKLLPEDLQIERFQTSPSKQNEKGTIVGNYCTCDYTCEGYRTAAPGHICIRC
jgi:hypothetical protein